VNIWAYISQYCPLKLSMVDKKRTDILKVSNTEDIVLFHWVSSAHPMTALHPRRHATSTKPMWEPHSSVGQKHILNFEWSGAFVFKIQFIFLMSPETCPFKHKSVALSQSHQKTFYKNMSVYMHINRMHTHEFWPKILVEIKNSNA
jgi:hypothetical protein